MPRSSQATHSHHPQQNVKPLHEFWLPTVILLGLLAVGISVTSNNGDMPRYAIFAAVGTLTIWLGVLAVISVREKRQLSFTIILRKQHYIQASVQFALFVYWGYYWRPVYDHAPFIAAQILFAYGFDLLLSWSRKREYVLGAGPFPIIFSINLFLWFKADWFYLQFVMIAVGLLGKEYVRWQRDGKSLHIFNPSAFTLGFFSLILLVTGTTELTWGPEIASTLTLAPHIYLFLFLIGLVVMYFFAITAVAASAAATLFLLSAISYQIEGVPYFLDSEIPAAVFLGLHLLITDPSTSPKNLAGKIMFGAAYGIGVFALYALLSLLEVPTFYDKLLCVPILNLSVIAIDRLSTRIRLPSLLALTPFMGTTKGNAVLMTGWVSLFLIMTAVGKTDGRHIGDQLPFWQQACAEQRSNACTRLMKLEATYCKDNSAWACNQLGLHYRQGNITSTDNQLANQFFSRACELRHASGCFNLIEPTAAFSENPHELDLRLLLREGGLNLMSTDQQALYQRACQHGWQFACDNSLTAR